MVGQISKLRVKDLELAKNLKSITKTNTLNINIKKLTKKQFLLIYI